MPLDREAVSALSTTALRRLDERLPWYRALGPRDRSWVGLVAQAGITTLVTWLQDRSTRLAIAGDVFGTAPRELTRSVTLGQTLDLVRTVLEVVEDHVADLCSNPQDPGQVQRVREAVLVYGREVAFSAATVYAEAAETRGSWDSRLESLIVDSLLGPEPDPALGSRVAALGWRPGRVVVVAGVPRPGDPIGEVERMRSAALGLADDVLVGHQGSRLVVFLTARPGAWEAATALAAHLGPGPVVLGSTAESLDTAGRAARAALRAVPAAAARPGAPRPVHADDLLPERLLAGDESARLTLLDRVDRPLRAAGTSFVETVTSYLECGRSLEATARALFVHPNTVRYRLRRAAELTGWDATQPRDAFVLQVAMTVARLGEAGRPPG